MVWTQLIYKINNIRILDIGNVIMEAKWDVHPIFEISCQIADDEYTNMRRMIHSETFMYISYRNEKEKEKILFTGLLEKGEVYQNITGTYVILKLTGMTRMLDKLKHTRVFQNKSMTYAEIINKILNKYGFYYLSDLNLEQRTNEIIVQYQETDWEFLQRIASHLNVGVLSNFDDKNKYIVIGLQKKNQKIVEFRDYTVKKRMKRFEEDTNISALEYEMVYTILTDIYLELGTKVTIMNQETFVSLCRTKKISEEVLFEYELVTENSFHKRKYYNDGIIGAALKGKIIDVANDQVKVMITDKDDDTEKPNASWLPYSTVYSSPDGTGWYCMPEIGDQVRVYFPNEIENDCYTISSVHASSGVMQRVRNNPDNKSLSTKYGKTIELSPNSIKITNGNGMLINISDDDGIVLLSASDINLTADGNISLISSADTVDICAAEGIKITQGDNSITIQDEITIEGSKVKMQ